MLLIALVLSPLAFVFGGFATLLALPGVLLARLRPAAFVYFGAALVWSVCSLAGFNPWAGYVQGRILDDLEQALGTRPTFAASSFNAGTGHLRFDSVTVDLPAIGGKAELVELTVDAGPGFVWNSARPRVAGRGLSVSFDGTRDFSAFMGRLEGQSTRALDLHFEAIDLQVTGAPMLADARIEVARGSVDAGGFAVEIWPRQLDLTLWGQTHPLALMGSASLERRGGQTALTMDLKAMDGDAIGLYAHGTLQSDVGPGGLVVTLDYLDLNQVWARYRKIDVYSGMARGTARISGSLNDLSLGLDFDIVNYSYFHRAVMALDESRAFVIPEAGLAGRLRVQDGKQVFFEGLTLSVPEGTLCTDPAMQAQGEAWLRLDGQFPKLTGQLEARVTTGRINRAISWSPVGTQALFDVQPNIIQVAEQFSDLNLAWTVEVNDLDLACEPLNGKLAGTLSGRLEKEPGKKAARLSVGGKLELAQGTFKFCAAQGEVTGAIEFNPNAPSYEANIRGALKGKVDSTGLDAEITGRLSHPGLVFTGITMHPDDLGRLIATSGEQDAAEKARRAEALSRLCGPAAAMNNNPFLAHKAGKVSFTFKP